MQGGRERDTLKPTIGDGSLYEITNVNAVNLWQQDLEEHN
jgi:hypothetical protein